MTQPANEWPATLVSDFHSNGFVLLHGFLDSAEVSTMRENVERFKTRVLHTLPREHVFFENIGDQQSLKQIQQMFAYDDYFHSIMFGGRFERLAATLLESEVRGVNMQYFNKPPSVGKPTPAHQDGFYFMLEPNEAVTMWLALEAADQETGCVRYVRGSHKDGLRPHGMTQTLGFSQGLLDYGPEDELREVAFPVQAGDLLVHHALTIHRADGNQSTTRTRQALGLIYYSQSARESDEKEQRQKELVQQLKDEGKI